MKIWAHPPLLRSTDAYISAKNTARFLKGKRKILIIGDAGGRDYEYLTSLGKEVHVLDIAPQANIPNLTIQSIENKTPFDSEAFDGVVLNEVLEHLWHDVSALNEIHRILNKNGILVITVPYLSNSQDVPEFHVRVHSPRTIRRLLENCGFKLKEHFCRGICCAAMKYFLWRSFIYFSIKIMELVFRKNVEASVDIINGSLDKIECFLGSYSLTIKLQKLTTAYGGVMCAEKVSGKRDFDLIQIKTFGDFGEKG